jgi:hypothetical protein
MAIKGASMLSPTRSKSSSFSIAAMP